MIIKFSRYEPNSAGPKYYFYINMYDCMMVAEALISLIFLVPLPDDYLFT